MAKYIYKLNYNNTLFLNSLKRIVDTSINSSDCTSDCMITIEVDSTKKADLDEYMNMHGFSYLFETTKTLSNTCNWGILTTAELPSSDVNVGDCVYCSTTNKPLWWNGSAWVDALGN